MKIFVMIVILLVMFGTLVNHANRLYYIEKKLADPEWKWTVKVLAEESYGS